MVYKCFVYGCKTHKFPKNTTFGIPKDPELLQEWVRVLRPYSNGKVLQSKHRVCKAHFRPEEIELYFVHNIHGTEVKIERGRPELKKGAVPSIFPGQKKPPRRILIRNPEAAKMTEQSILLLNGEWVHVKKSPPNKSSNSSKAKKNTTAAGKRKSTTSKKPKNSTENLNEALTAELPLLTGESLNETANIELPESETVNTDNQLLSTSELPSVKPPDKDLPSICINWDALPLPEEIGSLLCDSVVPHLSSTSDFNFQSPKSHSSLRPPLPKPALSTLPSLTPPLEYLPAEQCPQVNLSTADHTAQNLHNLFQDAEEFPKEELPKEEFPVQQSPREDLSCSDHVPENHEEEEDIPLSFQGLLLGLSEVQLPSPMWACHTDHNRVFFSFMSYGTPGCKAFPKVEKIVMYPGAMLPRIFLREIEVTIPASEKKSASFGDVEEVLSQVDKLKLCMGIDCSGDFVSYTSECDVFVESGRMARCQSCKKKRLEECSKKRHLETDNPRSSSFRSKKRNPRSSK